ncbi:DUF4844 domain-containing protein [Chitinophaga sp. G-6-1-13]|uniref:DUF4844 domain-containing protein n=1 Tax=Chitinophaga fulva TaxID=2728842 RepID=A0A848GS16_9BACT|nr:DUF4844 domain-containing protein [Chitinophaga fulva]NML39523.1 DUF4844 domain-containing protein [Chitinophaga fulva]
MNTQPFLITALSNFKERGKFSYSAYMDRGLNPSDDETRDGLERFFNHFADQLMMAAKQGGTEKDYKRLLMDALKMLNKNVFDTEDREFICDTFDELAGIVRVDLKDELNKWLYGSFLVSMMKVVDFIKGKKKEKVLEIRSEACTGCSQPLEALVLEKQQGIPDTDWWIVQCNSCREYNLFSIGPNIKELRFNGFHQVESLPRREFTEEQAFIRLEQIKYFRQR